MAEPPPITYNQPSGGGGGMGSLALGGMGAPLHYPPPPPPDLTPHMQQQQQQPPIEDRQKDMEQEQEKQEEDEDNHQEVGSGDPNPTLYIKNLNEKIKKQEMTLKLRQLFSQCGKIRKISIRKSLALKGQAFIIFRDTEGATNGLNKLQGYHIYGKPMRIGYAYEKSSITLKSEGKEPEKRPRHGRKGMAPVKLEGIKVEKQEPQSTAADHQGGEVVPIPGAPVPPPGGVDGVPPSQAPGGVAPMYPPPQGYPPYLPPGAAPAMDMNGHIVPHNILFAQGLPDDATADMLSALFKQYPGFVEVRMIPSKKGIAFVEYQSEQTAGAALQGLNNFKLTPEHPLNLSYARK